MIQTQSSDNRKFHLTALAVIAVIYIAGYIAPLGMRDMMRPDEFRYGEIPREMIASGDWVAPYLIGVRYFEKPGLGYQWTALCIKLFGENAFAVRLPSALSVGLTALMIYLLCARRREDPWLAPTASVIYLSFALVFGVGIFAVLDSQLAMALTWCIGAYYLACESDRFSRCTAYLALAGAAAGAAFLFKGFLAFAVPTVVIVPYLIWQKDWKKFLTTPWMPLLLAVAIALPWSIAVWQREPDFWRYFFIEEHIKRFTSGTYDRKPEPVWFFLPVLLGGMMPGGLLLAAGWKGFSKKIFSDPFYRYMLCWFVMPFLLFSASSCKLGTYILPCFPPLAVLIAAVWLKAWKESGEMLKNIFDRICRYLMVFMTVAGVVALLVMGCCILWMKKLPFGLPVDPRLLLLPLAAVVWGVILYWGSRRDLIGKMSALFGGFVIVAAWCAPAVLSDSFNTHKMPEKYLRNMIAEMQVTPEDVVVVDSSAAAAAAWVLKRTDLIFFGKMGELEYGFTNFPQDYAGRYYAHGQIQDLLKAHPDKRIFYINTRKVSKRAYPENWKVKRVISIRGVTVAELEK